MRALSDTHDEHAQPARILVIDDNASVRDLFHTIFAPPEPPVPAFEQLDSALTGAPQPKEPALQVQVALAANGKQGCELASQALQDGQPYALAFVDMRMPGWDGVTTIEALWRTDPDLQVVLCTAYSDYDWSTVVRRLGPFDRWFVLKKPFDFIEVQQMTAALSAKWLLERQRRERLAALQQELDQGLAELQRVRMTLRVVSQCNKVLSHSTSEEQLHTDVARCVLAEGMYCSARMVPAQDMHDEQLSGQRALVTRHVSGGISTAALPLTAGALRLGHFLLGTERPDAFDNNELNLLQELANNLAYGIANLRQGAARERLERQLAYQSNYDQVTGLPNRSLLRDRLGQALAYAARNGRQVAVLVVALDRFQTIREALGDDSAGVVLRQLGIRLQDAVRACDSVAHLTANEFVVMLSDLDQAEGLAPLGFRLVQQLGQPMRVGTQDVLTTASIGISLSATDGNDVDALLRNAASAAHCAQADGGQCLRFYAPHMNERIAARLALEADLHRALGASELLLHFQPKVNLNNGELVGAEALLRWHRPGQGMVMPADFIPQAEESGIIIPMGSWVISTACAQVRRWMDAGLPLVPVAVNVSARQFRQPGFVNMVRTVLHDSGINPGMLELEITESALMENLDASTSTLHELKAAGVRLTLDDFGTGYSSLSYLQRFPLDCLKIDRAFVRDLTTNPGDAAICRSIIDLAHALRLRVIGEGVESMGQMRYLRRHGCDEVQGYYFSRPLPITEYEAMLRSGTTFDLPQSRCAHDRTLLVVDDEPHILSSLRRVFRGQGYIVLTADNARDALELLAAHDVQVVLSDQRMPAMNGSEFLARVGSLYPATVRIILSGYTDLDAVVEAVNRGKLFKFLTKPWEDDHLREQVHEAFMYQERQSRTLMPEILEG